MSLGVGNAVPTGETAPCQDPPVELAKNGQCPTGYTILHVAVQDPTTQKYIEGDICLPSTAVKPDPAGNPTIYNSCNRAIAKVLVKGGTVPYELAPASDFGFQFVQKVLDLLKQSQTEQAPKLPTVDLSKLDLGELQEDVKEELSQLVETLKQMGAESAVATFDYPSALIFAGFGKFARNLGPMLQDQNKILSSIEQKLSDIADKLTDIGEKVQKMTEARKSEGQGQQSGSAGAEGQHAGGAEGGSQKPSTSAGGASASTAPCPEVDVVKPDDKCQCPNGYIKWKTSKGYVCIRVQGAEVEASRELRIRVENEGSEARIAISTELKPVEAEGVPEDCARKIADKIAENAVNCGGGWFPIPLPLPWFRHHQEVEKSGEGAEDKPFTAVVAERYGKAFEDLKDMLGLKK